MRPLELRLQGFRSYSGREEQRFDFRGRNLIAIVGPTGGGKSTILDAVSLALYDRTPRISKGGASLINQRAKEAMVRLRFEAKGSEWEAVRHLRKKGPNEHALYRYDKGDSSEPADRWGMAGVVNDKLEELLGLDFRAFNRSVLLAQGKFDEFLGAGDADKAKVLKDLFGFEQLDVMKQLAKERAKDVKNNIDILDVRLDGAKQAEIRCEELREEIKVAKARQERLEDAFPEFEKLDDKLTNLRQAMSTDRKQRDEKAELKLPDQKESKKTISDAEQAADKIAEADARLEEASQVVADAKDKIESPEFLQRSKNCQNAKVLIGGLRGLQKAYEDARGRTTEAIQKREDVAEQLGKSRRDLISAQEELIEAKEIDKRAGLALQVAQDALLDAQHQDMAAELRSGLEHGGDCPVCEQPVHDVPPAITSPGVSQAEEEVKEAEVESRKATKAVLDATGAVRRAEARLEGDEENLKVSKDMVESASGERDEAQKGLEKCLTELAKLLGEGDPCVRLQEEESSLNEIQEQARQASNAQEEARNALHNAHSDGAGTQAELSKLWTRLAGLAAKLSIEVSSSGDDPQAVREALRYIHKEHYRIVAELSDKLAESQTELDDAEKRRAELLIRYEIKRSAKEDLATIEARLEGLSANLETEEENAADLENWTNQIQSEQSRLDNYQRLNNDLMDGKGKFIDYLLEAKRVELSKIGSEHFQRLSSDRYRFSEDGKFDVIDLTLADATRGSDSLSGGETFLASLALAVALAEMVGREGGRLDAFMLDEGFGSLDQEYLDLAMEGVEKLASDSDRRLVVLVSHVAELRERVDDLLILEKDPATGDTKIVQGAGAA